MVELEKYNNITVSGKIATGTTTLAKNLRDALGWEYVNTGAIQRAYDTAHGVDQNAHGAMLRPDEHEREMEAFTKKTLTDKKHIVYEAWLSGFVAREIPDVFRVLVVCSEDAIRVDRVMNRDDLTLEQAKLFIQTREKENIAKWKELYGDYDFWNPKYFHMVINTYSLNAMEALNKVLDQLGHTAHT